MNSFHNNYISLTIIIFFPSQNHLLYFIETKYNYYICFLLIKIILLYFYIGRLFIYENCFNKTITVNENENVFSSVHQLLIHNIESLQSIIMCYPVNALYKINPIFDIFYVRTYKNLEFIVNLFHFLVGNLSPLQEKFILKSLNKQGFYFKCYFKRKYFDYCPIYIYPQLFTHNWTDFNLTFYTTIPVHEHLK